MGVIGTERCFVYGQSPPVKFFGFGISALTLVSSGQTAKGACDIGVVGSVGLFPKLQTAPVKRFRFGVTTLGPIKARQVMEAGGNVIPNDANSAFAR